MHLLPHFAKSTSSSKYVDLLRVNVFVGVVKVKETTTFLRLPSLLLMKSPCLFWRNVHDACVLLKSRKLTAFAFGAHLRNWSFVAKNIQHVEYSVQMARVKENSKNVTAHWGNLRTPTVTNKVLLKQIALVCAGLNTFLCVGGWGGSPVILRAYIFINQSMFDVDKRILIPANALFIYSLCF